jgi:hypothetical protein
MSTTWDHIDYLYVVTTQVEEEITKKKNEELDSTELINFLDDECESLDN